MKRVLSLVLTLAMVLSLMAGICISVGAEGEEYIYIEGAEVSGTPFPELAVGDTLPALSYSVPAGANYTVDAYWIGGEVGAAVEDGNVYTLRIEVIANDGYAFSFGFPLMINGEEYSFQPTNGQGEGFEYHLFTKDYAFLTPIDKVEVSYEEPEAGKALSTATVPAGAKYTAQTSWNDYNADSDPAVGDLAQKTGAYAIDIMLIPAEGYQFTDATELWVNGVKIEDEDIHYDYIGYWYGTYNLGDPVSAVSITHADPELGKTFSVPTVSGDNCAVLDYYWWDYTTQEKVAADGVAQKGHEYQLLVELNPDQGYKFTEDTTVTVNGAEPEIYTAYEDMLIYWSDVYDFLEEITEVSLTYAEPEVGKAFPQVTAPAGANYEVSSDWVDFYTGEVAVGEVKDGGKYELSVYASPADGYIFSEEAVLTVNGAPAEESNYDVYSYGLYYYDNYSFAKPVDKFEISYTMPEIGKAPGAITIPEGVNYTLGEHTGWYEYATGIKVTGNFEDGKRYEMRAELELDFGYEADENTKVYVNGEETDDFGYDDVTVYVYKYYTFAESVAKVELPAWPELKVGDKLPEISGEGEHYSYYVEWHGADADGNYLEGDTVVDGAAYYATIYVYPAEGYEFTEDTQITQGGKALSGWFYVDYGHIEVGNIYNFGAVKMVEKVELTTDIPGYGEKGGEVKIPENADYELEYAEWGVSTKDDYSDAKLATKAYTYGDHVLLVVQMYTEDGYLFSPDVVITLNGKEYEPVEISSYPDYMVVVYDLGEVTKPAATPETGDTTPVALLSFVCLSTLAGISLLLNKKRIAR